MRLRGFCQIELVMEDIMKDHILAVDDTIPVRIYRQGTEAADVSCVRFNLVDLQGRCEFFAIESLL